MKPGPVLLFSLPLLGCVSTETASIQLNLDRAACPATISSLSLFVLRIDKSDLCTLSQGVDSAGSGVAVLPLFQVEETEVAALALAYGTMPDGGGDLPRDGPKMDGPNTDGPKKDSPLWQDAPGASKCGNAICEKSLGETCKTCTQDCGLCDFGPPPMDSGTPAVDGSSAFGLGACVRCYGLTRVELNVASHVLKLVSADCKVPASAPQQAGLPAAALPPPTCQ